MPCGWQRIANGTPLSVQLLHPRFPRAGRQTLSCLVRPVEEGRRVYFMSRRVAAITPALAAPLHRSPASPARNKRCARSVRHHHHHHPRRQRAPGGGISARIRRARLWCTGALTTSGRRWSLGRWTPTLSGCPQWGESNSRSAQLTNSRSAQLTKTPRSA
jgi:hypothetical protein